MEIFLLFILGFGVGILSSFFGVGGGIIIVPTLFSLYPSMSSQEVIAISLLTIFLNSIINNYYFIKLKLSPSKHSIKLLVIFCAIGALSASMLVNVLNSKTIKLSFAVILLLVVAKLLFYKKNSLSSTENKFNEDKKLVSLTGLLGSFLSALTGLGGGVVFVPLFTDLVKVPLKRVSAYSNMAMMISVLFGLVPHVYTGSANFKYSFIIFLGAFAVSKFGIRLNNTVSETTKKYLLATLLLVSSIKILLF